MAGRKSDFTLPTNTLDELFSTQEERDDATAAFFVSGQSVTADRYTEYVFCCPLPHTPTPENYLTSR